MFISDGDVYCSMDKFDSGIVNILFITGLSGSGKSTLAREIADKYDAVLVELDVLIYFGKRHAFTKEKLEAIGQSILYEYILDTKKEPGFMQDTDEKQMTEESIKYINWIDHYPYRKKKFVIEGIDLVRIIPQNSIWMHYPIIFKGTSVITSLYRKLNRDGFGKAKENIHNPLDFIHWMKEIFSWYNEMYTEHNALRDLRGYSLKFGNHTVFINSSKGTFTEVLSIYNSLSKQEQLYISPKGKFIDSPNVVYRRVYYVNNKVAAFAELYDSSKLPGGIDGDVFFSLAVNPKYRGKGLGKSCLYDALDWFDASDFKSFTYRVDQANIASVKLAEGAWLKKLPQEELFEDIRDKEFVFVKYKK